MRAQNCFFFFKFTNLIQTEKKTHVPVTVGFPDYAFNENMHDVLLSRMGCFPDTLFLWQTQKLKNTSLLSLKKKKGTFACAIFGKICYVACVINRAGQLICLHASLHERNRAGLIYKSALKNKVQ